MRKKGTVEANIRQRYFDNLRRENPPPPPEYDTYTNFVCEDFAILLTLKSDKDAQNKVESLNFYKLNRCREGDADPNFEAKLGSTPNIVKLTGDMLGAAYALYDYNFISSAKRNALIQEARAENRRQKASAAAKQNGNTNGHDPKLFKAAKQPTHLAEGANKIVSPSAPKAEGAASEIVPTGDRPSSP